MGKLGTFTVTLLALAIVARLSWHWFDADEFVNLQQALRANAGHALYSATPSHHPPVYTWLLQGALGIGLNPLVTARGLSVVIAAASLATVAGWLGRHNARAGKRFLWLALGNAFLVLNLTRAMNEVLMLAFMAFAWVAILSARVRASGFRSGLAWGLAGLTRLSAAFYAPTAWRRTALVGTIIGAGLALLLLALIPSQDWHAMWQGVVQFHLGRHREPILWRLGKWLAYSGVPILALIAWSRRRTLDWRRPEVRLAAIATCGTVLMLALSVVHPHYFLPMWIIVACAVAWVVPESSWKIAFVAWIALGMGLASLGIAMTPNHDLQEAQEVADELATHLPGQVILTDAPQYAVLAGLENWGGYYWSLRGEPARLDGALDDVSAVVVSERFGHYDAGFPAAFLASLQAWDCLQGPGARIYLQNATGWVYPACT